MKLRNNNKGMTLVEVMVSVGVLSIVGTGLLTMSVACLRSWGNGASNEVANSNVTLAVQKLAFEIREARSATVSGSQLVAVFPKALTDPTSGEKGYDAVLNDAVTRSYYVSGGNLMRNKGGTISTLAKGISAVGNGPNDTKLSASGSAVDVTLWSAQQLGTSVRNQSATAHIALRNYR